MMQPAAVVQETLKIVSLLSLIAVLGTQSAIAETRDVDGDGIVDTVDQDDDNDGIPDRLELMPNGAERDSDLDGMPDRIDLDSDNDGILDVQESGAFLSVNFGNARVLNGRILADVGENGLVDLLETFVDSNKIAYRLQNTDEADGDVVPDYLDLDSDNDGILDLREAGVSAEHDKNRDGRIDVGNNAVGNDGILDAAQLNNDQNCCDYDFDGVEDIVPVNSDNGDLPDFQDLDSDNDGVLDLTEAGGSDLDLDGRIDDFFDDANAPDGVDDGLAIVPLAVPDSNDDGLADYRDGSVQYTGDVSAGNPDSSNNETEQNTDVDTGESSASDASTDPDEPTSPTDASSDLGGEADDGSTDADSTADAAGQPQDDGENANPFGPVATGLNGGAGCSVANRVLGAAGSTAVFDPLFVVLVLFAVGGLAYRGRQRGL